MNSFFRRTDFLIVVPTVFLIILGFIVLSSIIETSKIYLDYKLTTQFIAIILGFSLLFISSFIKEFWVRLGVPLYVVVVGLLILVLSTGIEVGGASRWILFRDIQIQPSELAKISLIIIQAKLLVSKKEQLNTPWPLLLSAIYTGIIVVLILFQPDLGTVIVLLGAWLTQLIFSNTPKRTLVLIVGIMLLSLPASYPFMADYQKDRLVTFFNPTLDTSGDGYNVQQASIAIGSGGLLGKGLEAGSQSQLNFLPAQHTDFIFAVIGEKLGFIGAIMVVLAFTILFMRTAIRISLTKNEFGRLVGLGILATLTIQTVINIGMNLGIAPVTGIPLPFISSGGTHIVVELTMIGMILSLTKIND